MGSPGAYQENARLAIEIRLAHERTRLSYGPERLQVELADHGIHAGVDRIKRIRRELGLRCRQKRKFRVTTDSRHNLPIAPNLLDRQFAASAPNRAWVRYNVRGNRRGMARLGYLSPAAFMQKHYAQKIAA